MCHKQLRRQNVFTRTCAKGETNLQEAGVCHHLLGIHHIYQRLFDGHVANAAHVEPVYVFPPCACTKQTLQTQMAPCEWACTQYLFSGFYCFLFFLSFQALAKLCSHNKGSRENKTERLTLPGRTVPLSFRLSGLYAKKDEPSRKYILASSSTSSRMSGSLFFFYYNLGWKHTKKHIPSVPSLHLALSGGQTLSLYDEMVSVPPTQRN